MKAIIFDLDGVICSTDHYHYLAWKELADELGIPFDKTDNEKLRGVSRQESLDIILEKSSKEYSQTEKELLTQKKNDLYLKYLQFMSPQDLSDEIKDTLEKLRQKNILLAIGSSSQNTKYILQQIGLDGFFDAVSDGTMIHYSKPHPEVFLNAAKQLQINPKECLVVEDAIAGCIAAKSANMKVAAISSAYGCVYADFHLNAFHDLLILS